MSKSKKQIKEDTSDNDELQNIDEIKSDDEDSPPQKIKKLRGPKTKTEKQTTASRKNIAKATQAKKDLLEVNKKEKSEKDKLEEDNLSALEELLNPKVKPQEQLPQQVYQGNDMSKLIESYFNSLKNEITELKTSHANTSKNIEKMYMAKKEKDKLKKSQPQKNIILKQTEGSQEDYWKQISQKILGK